MVHKDYKSLDKILKEGYPVMYISNLIKKPKWNAPQSKSAYKIPFFLLLEKIIKQSSDFLIR